MSCATGRRHKRYSHRRAVDVVTELEAVFAECWTACAEQVMRLHEERTEQVCFIELDLVLVANAMYNDFEVDISVLEAFELKCRPTTLFRATVGGR